VLLGFGGVVQRIREDNFSQQLQAMAGPNAIYCQQSACMTDAFRRGQPFWTRTERHYEPMLSCNGPTGPIDLSEGRVYTSEKVYYDLTRYPPSGLRPARIIKRRWINPHLSTGPMGEQGISCDSSVEIEPSGE
jgi:hypothetical protein